jgi:hypothetical protein
MTTNQPITIWMPMMFSGPMVRAILEGRKTQTRRIMKPQPDYFGKQDGLDDWHWNGWRWQDHPGTKLRGPEEDAPHPIGSGIWARETWHPQKSCKGPASYRATWSTDDDPPDEGWKPSIFMPRWAARIFLDVTSARVERLQMIDADDAEKEGVGCGVSDETGGPVARFKTLWESINGKGSWSKNPWVWVYEFKRTDQRP